MIKQLLLCLTLMTAQMVSQSVCCCHLVGENSEPPNTESSSNVQAGHQHHSGGCLHSRHHCHHPGGDDGHHEHDCSCDSNDLISVVDVELSRQRDFNLPVFAATYDDCRFALLDSGSCQVNRSPATQIPQVALRAHLGLWQL